MSDPGADAEAVITATLDEASIANIIREFAQAFLKIAQMGTGAFDNFQEAAVTGTKAAAKNVRSLKGPILELSHDIDKMAQILETSLSETNAQIVKMAQILQGLGVEANVQAAGIRASGTIVRQTAIGTRETTAALSRQRLAEIRNEGRVAFVEGQKQLIVSRELEKRRTASHAAMLQTMARAEKAFGAIVVGIAKTTTSAFSKVASGVSAVFSRAFSRSSADVKGLDRQLTSGVSGSLRSRENAMRQSFTRQEQIISRSARRQQEALTGLRTQTQTGVVGAANRGLNISAFIGGAAVIAAVRSTFSIGSEFTRGMAVLQAQLNLTDEAMQGVHDTAIQLGNDITLPGVSALDAAEAIQILSKQFAELGPAAVDAAEEAAKGTLQLSRAAGVGAEEAASVVGAAVNVFGIAAGKATEVADQVAAALKNAAGVSFGDFADAFKQSAAVFAQFQVPAVGATEALIQFDAALAIIARKGIVGSDAGTSLKQFFLQANRNVDATKDALAELTAAAGETGTAFFDAAGNARPLEKTLDILRRGLKGLTDEQRTSTLQTIFGSDAIRVANALLETSTEEYSKVVKSLREQGLAAKIAAAQNTGLKGALDALKSVVETIQILLFEKLNPILGDIVLTFTEVANAVFFGAGAFEVLRKALLGAAIGMTAIIAAKAAVEVVSLLGKAAALAVTPFGALLIGAALLGAAFAVMSDKSEPFRAAVDKIGEAIKPTVTALKGGFFSVLEKIGTLITETVIPALEDLAVWLVQHVLPAFRAVKSIIVDGVIPAVVNLAGIVGTAAVRAWDAVTERAKGFWHSIEPLIRPAIDGLHSLVNAIGAVFSDRDFSGLRDGFNDAIAGIVATAGNIVARIGEALAPIAKTVFDFFRDLFSPENIKKYTAGFLKFVEEVGRIVGLIVSDPLLFKAIAAVAAAAAVLAFTLVKGFVRGVIENLPELFSLLRDALAAGFRLAFDNLGLVIGAVFLGAGLFRAFNSIKGVFTKAGQSAGEGFLSGFKASAKSVGQFLTTLRSGQPAFGDLNQQANEASSLQRQLRVLGSSSTVTLDSTSINAAKREVELLRGSITDAQFAALKLRDNFNLARTAASGIAAGVKGMASGLRAIATGFGAALEASGKMFAATRPRGPTFMEKLRFDTKKYVAEAKTAFFPTEVGLKNIARNASDTASFLKFKLTPAVKGVAAAVRGVGETAKVAFTPVTEGWKMVGAGAVRAGGAIGEAFKKAYRVVSDGASKLGDSIKSSRLALSARSAASAFGQEFSKGWTSIRTSFTNMLDSLAFVAKEKGTTVGKLIGEGLAKAAIGAAAAVGGFVAGKAEGAQGGSGLLSAILGGVSAGALVGGGFGVAVGVVTAGMSLIGAAFGRAEKKAKAFKEEAKKLAQTFSGVLVSAIKDGTLALEKLADVDVGDVLKNPDALDVAVSSIAEALGTSGVNLTNDLGLNIQKDILPLLEAAKGDMEEFGQTVQNVFIQAAANSDGFKSRFGSNVGAVRQVLLDIAAVGGSKSVTDWLRKMGSKGVKNALTEAVLANEDFLQSILNTSGGLASQGALIQSQIDDAKAYAAVVAKPPPAKSRTIFSFLDNIPSTARATALAQGMLRAGLSIDEVHSKLEELKLPDVDTTAWEADMNAAARAVDTTAQVLSDARQTVADLFKPPDATPLTDAFNEAVTSVDGVADTVQEALANGLTTLGQAQSANAFAGLRSTIGAVISEGVTEGLSPTNIEGKLRELQQVMIDSLDPNAPGFDEAKFAIVAAFNGAITGLVPSIDAVKAAETAAEFATRVQDYMTQHPLALQADVETVISAQDTLAAALAGGTPGQIREARDDLDAAVAKADLQVDIPVSVKIPPPSEVQTQTKQTGLAAVRGFANGMRLFSFISDAAARAMARSAIASAEAALGVSSPSKEFMKIGNFVGEGFAIGIDASADLAAESARAAVTGAIDAAQALANSGVGLRIDTNMDSLPTSSSVAAQARATSAAQAGSTQTLTPTDVVRLAKAISAETKPNVQIDQTFNEKVDSRAIATDVAWRLGT